MAASTMLRSAPGVHADVEHTLHVHVLHALEPYPCYVLRAEAGAGCHVAMQRGVYRDCYDKNQWKGAAVIYIAQTSSFNCVDTCHILDGQTDGAAACKPQVAQKQSKLRKRSYS